LGGPGSFALGKQVKGKREPGKNEKVLMKRRGGLVQESPEEGKTFKSRGSLCWGVVEENSVGG